MWRQRKSFEDDPPRGSTVTDRRHHQRCTADTIFCRAESNRSRLINGRGLYGLVYHYRLFWNRASRHARQWRAESTVGRLRGMYVDDFGSVSKSNDCDHGWQQTDAQSSADSECNTSATGCDSGTDRNANAIAVSDRHRRGDTNRYADARSNGNSFGASRNASVDVATNRYLSTDAHLATNLLADADTNTNTNANAGSNTNTNTDTNTWAALGIADEHRILRYESDHERHHYGSKLYGGIRRERMHRHRNARAGRRGNVHCEIRRDGKLHDQR